MARVKPPNPPSSRRSKPARTPEERENQLIALAVDLVEQRLLDGTASAQETTHFLKLASSKAKLECERLAKENKLLEAKTKALEDQADMKALYADAIKAMQLYNGQQANNYDDYDDYDDGDYYDRR